MDPGNLNLYVPPLGVDASSLTSSSNTRPASSISLTTDRLTPFFSIFLSTFFKRGCRFFRAFCAQSPMCFSISCLHSPDTL